MRRLVMALASFAVAAAVAVGSASAATGTVTTSTSSNWAGYAVSSADPAVPTVYSSVSGAWIQPAATCTQGAASYSAFWVGLGGFSDTSQALEQIGTEATCNASGTATYDVWYELVPAASVPVKLTLRAGDAVTAAVTVFGQKVTVKITNLTRKKTFSKVLTMSAPDVSSAEWIAEAPSTCSASGSCRALPLADFGNVPFSSARATANGHTGTITDPAWAATQVLLSGTGGAGRFAGRFGPAAATGTATPTGLNATGGAFSVLWSDPAASPAVAP